MWYQNSCTIILKNHIKLFLTISSEKLLIHSFQRVFDAADRCRCKVRYLYTWFCSFWCLNTVDSDEFLYVAFNQNVYSSSLNTTSMPFHFFILQDILFKSIDANFARDCKTHDWFFLFCVCLLISFIQNVRSRGLLIGVIEYCSKSLTYTCFPSIDHI